MSKPKSEHEMREPLAVFLADRRYTVLWAEELGGGDFFDVVAVGDDVGAVELKLANPKKLYWQARMRLYYVNWAAVVMPSEKSLRTIEEYDRKCVERSPATRGVGLWHFNGERIVSIREPTHGEPEQSSHHTINMIRRIQKCKDLGISNEAAWGHERGISLVGLQYQTKTMYGKRIPKEPLLDEFED